MQRLETLTTTVYPCHCDLMGHLTTAQYTLLFDAATWSLLHSAGLHDEFRPDARHGWADVEVTVRYRLEVRAGDLVGIMSGLSRIGTKSMTVSHRLQIGDSLHATYDAVTVRLDRIARRAIEVPATARALLLEPDA